jgi:G3E family GTPase
MQEDLIDTAPDIPVYLFTGFLDAGKTKFIQETLEDKRFNRGERTLVLMCEEGVEEYDLSRLKKKNVFIRGIDSEEELTEEVLTKLEKELEIERVLVEYNGMWLLDTLYNNMPQRWVVYQEFMFADCRSFISYNANMRQLVYDKLKSCELVVLNRAPKDVDMTEYHKIIRGANRRCDIAFEHPDGSVDYDQTEDPLPFDIDADVVEIQDKDYAIWYRDLGEELDKYDGKTVRFKGQVALSDELPEDCFIIGRQMMNCCAADVSYAGLVVEKSVRTGWQSGDWLTITAKITVKKHAAYDRIGPVLTAIEVLTAEPAEDEVATFY